MRPLRRCQFPAQLPYITTLVEPTDRQMSLVALLVMIHAAAAAAFSELLILAHAVGAEVYRSLETDSTDTRPAAG